MKLWKLAKSDRFDFDLFKRCIDGLENTLFKRGFEPLLKIVIPFSDLGHYQVSSLMIGKSLEYSF